MAIHISELASSFSVCSICYFRLAHIHAASALSTHHCIFSANCEIIRIGPQHIFRQPNSVHHGCSNRMAGAFCFFHAKLDTIFPRDFTAKFLFQALLNCFYYVGAFSETVGYGNRVTTFLEKATNSKEIGHGHELLLKSEPTGTSAVRLSRFASRLHSEHSSIVAAEFSHVTVKNPANTILIADLCMQVKMPIGLTAQAPLYSCVSLCFYLWASLFIVKIYSGLFILNRKRVLTPPSSLVKIYSGQGVLISGPSGCGKSSILRVAGRLWPAAAGYVKIPQHVGPDGVFFLPQRKFRRMKIGFCRLVL